MVTSSFSLAEELLFISCLGTNVSYFFSLGGNSETADTAATAAAPNSSAHSRVFSSSTARSLAFVAEISFALAIIR